MKVVAISGPSGAGKTRLLAKLVRALVRRGLSVAVVKHTRHEHAFDRPGKDTDVLRRAGAIAAAIEGPRGMALFGPPAGSLAGLARLLPRVDLVLAEGFRGEPVPRIEVHRRRVSRAFLCARDPSVFAVVTDEPPPRAIPAFRATDAEGIADLVHARFGRRRGPRSRARLRVRPTVSSVRAGTSERTVTLGRRGRMARTTKRKSGSRRGRRIGTSRSEAGRKGGNATLRSRGPEFYSEIGRKGGKSRGKRQRSALRAKGRAPRSRRTSRARRSRSPAR